MQMVSGFHKFDNSWQTRIKPKRKKQWQSGNHDLVAQLPDDGSPADLVPRLDRWPAWQYQIRFHMGKRALSLFRLKQEGKGRICLVRRKAGDLRKWASRESSLAERRNQPAGKQEKTFCSLPFLLPGYVSAKFLLPGNMRTEFSRPLVSVANCLLRCPCNPRSKNSSCKTQKSARAEQVKGIRQKTSLKQSFAWRRPFDWIWGTCIFHGLLHHRLSR